MRDNANIAFPEVKLGNQFVGSQYKACRSMSYQNMLVNDDDMKL